VAAIDAKTVAAAAAIHYSGAMTVADDIYSLVVRRHGLTELEIARELFGGDGYQQQVNLPCRQLIDEGRIQRRGQGGPREPFTYYPLRIRARRRITPR
jgi:hypothetical protein